MRRGAVVSWLDIALAVSTIAASASAVWTWWYTRSDRKSDAIQDQIEEALGPVMKQVAELSLKLDAHLSTASATTEAAIERSLGPVGRDIAVLKNQVEVFWKQVGFNMATTLHQPDPARVHVDRLLEKFMAGTLAREEETELYRLLVLIRDWEPGEQLDFPVHPGEPLAAAMLLSVMQYVIPPREPATGGRHARNLHP
jgi:hypothetical protein